MIGWHSLRQFPVLLGNDRQTQGERTLVVTPNAEQILSLVSDILAPNTFTQTIAVFSEARQNEIYSALRPEVSFLPLSLLHFTSHSLFPHIFRSLSLSLALSRVLSLALFRSPSLTPPCLLFLKRALSFSLALSLTHRLSLAFAFSLALPPPSALCATLEPEFQWCTIM